MIRSTTSLHELPLGFSQHIQTAKALDFGHCLKYVRNNFTFYVPLKT